MRLLVIELEGPGRQTPVQPLGAQALGGVKEALGDEPDLPIDTDIAVPERQIRRQISESAGGAAIANYNILGKQQVQQTAPVFQCDV